MERIPFLKLEKIVNKHVHLDTPMERALQMQSQLDALQDAKIDANSEALNKLNSTKKK